MHIDNLSEPGNGVAFFLSNRSNPVSREGQLWNHPLPMNRENQNTGSNFSICYGDYFKAAQLFLEENNHKLLRKVLSQENQKNFSFEEIQSKNIFLEKHGEFYHPARVELVFKNQKINFVLNIAVSDSGLEIIETEYAVLKRLTREIPFAYIPNVYGIGSINTEKARFHMFLGTWFNGFSEFHITETSDKKRKIVVWDQVQGNSCLTHDQTRDLYQKAAFLLTVYYNPITFEHIFPWHHAAGDFIVRQSNNQVDIRLITVRNYVSLDSETKDPDLQSILEALLVFFLTLSVRMRIDRLDGVGKVVWSDDFSVLETMNGFFNGLAEMPAENTGNIQLAEYFEYYLVSMEENDLLELSLDVANHYHPGAPERPIILENIENHVKSIKQAIIKRLT